MLRRVDLRPLAVSTIWLLIGVLTSVVMVRRRLVRIAEHSMMPALQPGDLVLTLPLGGTPRRGQVIVFEHPRRPEFLLVKRVIGLPGERVSITDLGVHVEGALIVEPWAGETTGPQGTWRVAEGQAFVLGDRRTWSADDSRSLGPISLASAWRVVWRVWPPRRVGPPA